MGKPKFKIGEYVYSWQNPNVKRRISHRRYDGDGYGYSYKVALKDSEGYSRSSKWMPESDLTKRRTQKWIRENVFVMNKGRVN